MSEYSPCEDYRRQSSFNYHTGVLGVRLQIVYEKNGWFKLKKTRKYISIVQFLTNKTLDRVD